MKKIIPILLLFFVVSVSVISGIIFNDKLIGRSLDFPLTPVSYLNRNIFLRNFYSWWGSHNGGARNTFGAALIPVNSILYFPVFLGAGPWFTARYQMALTLFLAMFFFYLLAKRILDEYNIAEKYKVVLSILGGLFFTLNGYFFCELIFGSNVMYLTFSFIPLLLYSIISYHRTARKTLFFILSLLSLIIVSSTLQHLVLAYFLLIILSIVYKDIKLFLKLGICHFLFGFYWIIPLLYASSEIIGSEMAGDYAENLKISAPTFLEAVINKEYVFRRNIYNLALNKSFLIWAWLFNGFLLLIVSLSCLLKPKIFKKEHRKIISGFLIVFLMSLMLLTGARRPFGSVVLFLYNHFSVFNLYRSLQHYISFYVIGISVLFIFSGLFLLKKRKAFVFMLALLIFINALPWWYTLDLGTKNIASSNQVPSYFGQFYLTEGNKKMYGLNKLALDFGVLHLPPGFSVSFLAVGKNDFDFFTYRDLKIHSQGGDAGLAFGNKKFYSTDGQTPNLTDILNILEEKMYTESDFFNKNKNLFPFLNIRYFVLREDINPIFSKNANIFNIQNIRHAITQSDIFSSIKNEDFISIIKLKDQYFLPHFYTPKDLIKADKSLNDLPQVVSGLGEQIRSAIYLNEQNKDNLQKINQSPDIISNTPVLEFKRINPTKYKVVVHQAKEDFPLVFTESFHRNWEVYISSPTLPIQNLNLNNLLSSYKVSDENREEQVAKEELEHYIESDWISALGNSFISKNFQDTIQNENLSRGHIWDTWLRKPAITQENHWLANGYVNSWWIALDKIKKSGEYIQNPDGSIDFELIIEFWPQRLICLGFIVSGLVLFGCLGHLGYRRFKKRKRRDSALANETGAV